MPEAADPECGAGHSRSRYDGDAGCGKGERSEGRLGYRSSYYTRSLITRVGKIGLKVPQDRQGRFGGSRPSCSSAISARRRRWLRLWARCPCKASRRGRSSR
ncbi:transposase [Bradyrhizobium sp. SSUT112]|uniref:transposase n=1 Tax=Bradyrhizobium sp. SSUT112 TaxID=3040604 RepID=UPI00244B1C26|nr:transposase [Bradyrhizobium sp. SSUT112]MDH2356903.1 transposase [Bradyrhizobium sp. SSUT112]